MKIQIKFIPCSQILIPLSMFMPEKKKIRRLWEAKRHKSAIPFIRTNLD